MLIKKESGISSSCTVSPHRSFLCRGPDPGKKIRFPPGNRPSFIATFLGLCFLVLLVDCGGSIDSHRPQYVRSPDGKVEVCFFLKDGKPYYRLSWSGRAIIMASSLGIEFRDAPPFDDDFRIVDVLRKSADRTWQPTWGAAVEVRDHYNQMTVKLKEQMSPGRKLELEFRAYDDGIGFRYVFPRQEDFSDFTIEEENTEFRFAGEFTCWWVDRNPGKAFRSWGVLIGGPTKLSQLPAAFTPITMEADERCYISLHEVALDDYAAMNVVNVSDEGGLALKSRLAGPVTAAAPHMSPWRTVQLGRTPGELIESSLILNLNKPCALEYTDWIKPGISTWDWRTRGARVDGFTYDLNTATIKRLIDFSSDNHIDYCLIDAGWYGPEQESSDPVTCIEQIDVPHLAAYARDQGVGLWVYVNSKALKHFNLDRTFSTYQEWGIVGIKHGFLSDPSQAGVNFCHEVLKKAAEYRLMYTCHEALKPTGFRRTYPNFMSREYCHSLADGQILSEPKYHVILPFVNMLGGPLDHTPGMFDLDNAKERDYVRGEIKSTLMAQVARCVVISTGVLNLPDHGEAYRKKSDVFEFIRELPMNWDETKVINGKIGDYITVSRRKGDDWFIGSLTNETGRTLDIPLKFLRPGRYAAHVYSDAPDAHYIHNREAYLVEQMTVDPSTTIKAVLAPGGGHAVRISKEAQIK